MQRSFQFQGLPARICWFGLGERAKAGQLFNELVRTGKVSCPIVIGANHLDCGSVASPNRETEAMEGRHRRRLRLGDLERGSSTPPAAHPGSPSTTAAASASASASMPDKSSSPTAHRAAKRLERVLTNDPSMGIFRHADAGYELAQQCAREQGVRIPMA